MKKRKEWTKQYIVLFVCASSHSVMVWLLSLQFTGDKDENNCRELQQLSSCGYDNESRSCYIQWANVFVWIVLISSTCMGISYQHVSIKTSDTQNHFLAFASLLFVAFFLDKERYYANSTVYFFFIKRIFFFKRFKFQIEKGIVLPR